ncbi:hypothetical protein [Agarivorans sp. JK6]|uniref:hypothetical protein n=1 Tax=Agarivorans sp. JK6 TaxID=2997426 RepID=UPI0038734943
MLTILIGLNSATATEPGEVQVVRMTPKQSEVDVSHDYLVKLLELAINETELEFGPAKVEFMPVNLGQNLVLELLDIENVLDVVASAPTPEREVQFRSARVPLFMGLLGYRMMLIKPRDQAKFAAITRPDQLKTLRACQGSAWPDADILEAQGYQVVRVDELATMFEYLQDGKCDYFPRAITEGYGELAFYNQRNPNRPLADFDQILLHYTVPLYFFTSHRNYVLASRLQLGLERAIAKGRMQELMAQHPVTQVAYPLDKWRETVVFEVLNPDLPKSTPLYNPRLWQQLPVKEHLQ